MSDVNMASSMLNPQERKDLEKFTKFLALKSAQIIVQSRQGNKVLSNNDCPPSGLDWFNLAIPDDAQVSMDTKKVLNGEIINALSRIFCVEISLKTVEGDEMVLETWSLGIRTDTCDPNMKVMCTVYYRMGILLKSLITITRITPAYKLSRQQNSDCYSISYRVYSGEPNLQCLGEDYKKIKIGQLSTPVGTISLTMNYRTVMTISPTKRQKTSDSIMVKSDHFPRESPKHYKRDTNEKKVVDLNKPLTAGAFVDTEKIKELHNTLSQQLPPEPPMAWLLAEKERLEQEMKKRTILESALSEEDEEIKESTVPSTSQTKAIEVPNAKTNKYADEGQKYSKVMEFPFADGSPITELANFYQECLSARSRTNEWCDAMEDTHSTSSDSDALSRQLKMFEEAVPEFDNMVASMFSNSDNADS